VFTFLRKKNGITIESVKLVTDNNNQRLREMAIHNSNMVKTMDRMAYAAEKQTEVLTKLEVLFEAHLKN